jgi:Icc-related predicted phosphoesterase
VRILVVSDLHYGLRHYDWLVGAVDDVDVVAIVGDLADIVSPVPHEVQTVVLTKYLTMLAEKVVVLTASGNHDLDGPGVHGEQVATWLQQARAEGIHVDGDSVDIDGTRFTICPWWDGDATRAQVDAQLRAAAVDRPERWVWLYHSPPAGTVLCRSNRREFPDHELAAWIAEHQPDLVLCGHIHEAPWINDGSWWATLGATRVFNAGRTRGPIPAHITLDLDAATAHWYGVFDSETITL